METTVESGKTRVGLALAGHLNTTKAILPVYSVKKSGRYTMMVQALRNKSGAKPWVEATIANLETAIKGIQSGGIGKFLRFMASCWKYSLQNQFLISVQHPTAEVVAGASRWREQYGAYVKQGQKAIWILAPNMIDVRNEVTGDWEKRCVGFFPVRVFAQDQIDKTVPTICQPISGDSGKLPEAQKVANAFGLTIKETDNLVANGNLNHETKTITVKATNGANMRTKTIFHEIAHEIDIYLAEQDERNIQEEEIVAESSAFVICQSLGIDSTEYSAQYVASWSKMDCDKIHELLSRIKYVVDEVQSNLL